MNSKDKAMVFMFICVGVLALSVVYSLGARSVQAQATPDTTIIAVDNGNYVLSNGDIYEVSHYDGQFGLTWSHRYLGNFYAVIGTVAGTRSTLGDAKRQYR
jgi:hypothetical protein